MLIEITMGDVALTFAVSYLAALLYTIVHEAGHFMAARVFGHDVARVSLGTVGAGLAWERGRGLHFGRLGHPHVRGPRADGEGVGIILAAGAIANLCAAAAFLVVTYLSAGGTVWTLGFVNIGSMLFTQPLLCFLAVSSFFHLLGTVNLVPFRLLGGRSDGYNLTLYLRGELTDLD